MAETDDVLVRYAFHCAQLADDTFVVDALHAVEEISRLFTLTVDLRTLDPDLSFGDIVGHPASLEMRQLDQPVFLSGLVTHLEQTSAEDGQYLYRASVRPRLWRLTLSAHTRVFQHLTARSIVQQVLEENGVPASDIRFEVAGTLPEREFCVQYQETDLQFVSRLLEYEGLCYFFEHEADKEILVITDDPQAHPAIVGDGLAYHPRTGQVPDQETIFELVYQERLVTERVLLADYNAETPDVQVSALSSPVPDQTGLRYEYGPHVKDNDQAGRLAEIRKEEIACQRVVLDGRSDATVLRVGHTFDLGDYFRSDLNQRYLITRVEHRRVRADEASLHLTVASDDTPERMAYENRFTCIPWSVPYRPPRRTPVPRVPGLLTAKLETAGGPYAYLDDQGRYRFRALFDQSSTGAATASLAARKAEPHAGTNYGIHFPDHAGNEVVLAFENGDPDRPVIMATMANPSNPSPA
ncbi:MAG: type VI secretion system tip protein TssI/VgrG, partial [Bacteroidota bacterium]